MADYDLFDLTDITFDPPEKAPKKVKEAIEKAIKDLDSALGKETQTMNRIKINEKKDFLSDLLIISKSEIFSSDGKLTDLFIKKAQEHTNREISNLSSIVYIDKLAGKHTVTNAAIKSMVNKTKLSIENIKKIYTDAGFEIIDIDPLADKPKFPTRADKIYEDIQDIQKLAALAKYKNNPNISGLNLVSDLYSLAAYLQGELENALEYRENKETSELLKIFNDYAAKYSSITDDLIKHLVNIATNGKIYVFDSNENRRAYEAFLLYKNPDLTKLFASIKGMSKTSLKEAKTADECIKRISKYFTDYKAALAIYNDAAGLKDDPYIPETAVFYVNCSYCQNQNKFETLNEAQKINKCKCGKELYKKCTNCNRLVLVSSDKCPYPECGFVFANMINFGKHMTNAEKALREGNFEDARQYLDKAKLANPGEKIQTSELTKRINAEEEKYKEPLNILRKLIASKKYLEASEFLVQTIHKFPGLNVTSFETEIKDVKLKAQTAFDSVKNQNVSEKAEICFNILNYFIDFKPAIDFLKNTQPQPVTKITADISKNNIVTINWARSQEKNVLYCIVRKTGKNIPMNEKDGELLKDNLSDTFYNDESISPGSYYSYGVFAKRVIENKAVYSSPLGSTIAFIAEVTEDARDQIGTSIRITWKLPKNSLGASVSRIEGGREIVLAENAQYNYEDKNIEYGKTYIYIIKANYHDMPACKGVRLEAITPSEKIDSFKIDIEHIKDNKYKIKWDIERKNIELHIIINKKIFTGYNSNFKECEIELSKNDFYIIEVEALSGGNWLAAKNNAEISTYSSCEIDKSTLLVEENKNGIIYTKLNIKIAGDIPDNAVEFIYFVRTKLKPDQPPPYVNYTEILKTQDIRKIPVENCIKNKGYIFYNEKAKDEDAYYVTIFTVYNVNGKKVFSSPCKKRYGRELKVDVSWKITKLLFGKYNLSIEAQSNYPFSEMPEIILFANNREIVKIPKDTFENKKNYTKTIEINIDKIEKKSILNLKAEPVQNADFAFRWGKGFKGTI